MRGVEIVNGVPRCYYAYSRTGPKFFYKKRATILRLPFQKGPSSQQQRREEEEEEEPHGDYVPYEAPKNLSKAQTVLSQMPVNVQTLINTWLLIFDFSTVDNVNINDTNKAFRRLSLIHHPDRGGSEDKYKELSAVRDHLITLCVMVAVI
jgi:hypothetical protein